MPVFSGVNLRVTSPPALLNLVTVMLAPSSRVRDRSSSMSTSRPSRRISTSLISVGINEIVPFLAFGEVEITRGVDKMYSNENLLETKDPGAYCTCICLMPAVSPILLGTVKVA